MFRFTLRETALAGLIAAVYTLLSLFFAPISFAVYQIRVAEALTVIPYLTRAAIPGLFVGCALANQFGSQGWPDIVFGSLLTLVAAILTRFSRRLATFWGGRWLAVIPVAGLWLGGSVLLWTADWDWTIEGSKLLAAVVLAFAAGWWWWDQKSQRVFTWVFVVVSLGLLVNLFVVTSWEGDSRWSAVVGSVSLLAAWATTLMWVRMIYTGRDPTTLLAPLPPVLINAFGVPAYLAPMYGLDYWFAVQMVGIGQLVACYLLGLPLLKILERRVGVRALGRVADGQ